MKKNYQSFKMILIIVSFFMQSNLQAQKLCVECQTDVKSIVDNQVLLEKIDISSETLLEKVSTNIYVSYRSGNAQKFWGNIAIATAGVAVSTQFNGSANAEGRVNKSAVSPIIPLGVTVATLPSIWKNRPRSLPQAGLYLVHRDISGKLVNTWEQPLSKEAKNSAELLTIAIDKPLSTGTLEVYLQNGSNNEVYYWGLNTIKSFSTLQKEVVALKPQEPLVTSLSIVGCPDGFISNGEGKCYNATIDKYVPEGTESNPITIRKEIGSRIYDFNPKSNTMGKKLLPPKPNPEPNPELCVINWYWCVDYDCAYLYTTDCGGMQTIGNGDGGGGGEDTEERKMSSLNWNVIDQSSGGFGFRIVSNETGYVKRSTRNPSWKVYQDVTHNTLRDVGVSVNDLSYFLIRPPHTNHSDLNASIGIFINISHKYEGLFEEPRKIAWDFETFKSWSANQIASH